MMFSSCEFKNKTKQNQANKTTPKPNKQKARRSQVLDFAMSNKDSYLYYRVSLSVHNKTTNFALS